MSIDRDGICSLIPHTGSMCLLDAVLDWDEGTILCSTRSHLDPANPLRRNGRLAAVHLLEYGAQAMAVHGGLMMRRDGRQPESGFLAALHDVRLRCEYLEDLDTPLEIRASRIAALPGIYKYRFTAASVNRQLASGCATVLLNTGEDA